MPVGPRKLWETGSYREKRPCQYPEGPSRGYFFTGLAEEITKTSVPGAHTDNAFAVNIVRDASDVAEWVQGVGTGGTISAVYDSARREEVIHFTGGGRFDTSTGAITDKRVLSMWHRQGSSGNDKAHPMRFLHCKPISSSSRVP